MESLLQYPVASSSELKRSLLGRTLESLPTPVAVVDRHVVEANCRKMLNACKDLNVLFRAHVKTHKSVEITRLQMGDSLPHINLIVSTVNEAEYLKDYLSECKQQKKTVNVLYGLPIAPSYIPRLAELGKFLGPGSIGLLVDKTSQLKALPKFHEVSGFGPYVTFKIDTGYHRAGVPYNSKELESLVQETVEAEKQGLCKIHGVYSHSGHSYAATSPEENMSCLLEEIQRLSESALTVKNLLAEEKETRRMIMSVGATPSSSSAINLLGPDSPHNQSTTAQQLRQTLSEVLAKGLSVELHAGNYPFLDLQQLHTQASTSTFAGDGSPELITTKDIAFSVLAEVASVYPSRSPPQALIAAGCLALGREPCPGYTGYGMLSDWGISGSGKGNGYSGWEVSKVSQEHGMLQKSGEGNEMAGVVERTSGERTMGEVELRVGQKVRVWPNHSCVAAAGFGFYAVIDSSQKEGKRDTVVDVWPRCRGW